MYLETIIAIQSEIIAKYEKLEHIRFYELNSYRRMFKVLSLKNEIENFNFFLHGKY